MNLAFIFGPSRTINSVFCEQLMLEADAVAFDRKQPVGIISIAANHHEVFVDLTGLPIPIIKGFRQP